MSFDDNEEILGCVDQINLLENWFKQFQNNNVINPNLLVYGPNGCGKSYICKRIMNKYSFEPVKIDFHSIKSNFTLNGETLKSTTNTKSEKVPIVSYYNSLRCGELMSPIINSALIKSANINGCKNQSSSQFKSQKYANTSQSSLQLIATKRKMIFIDTIECYNSLAECQILKGLIDQNAKKKKIPILIITGSKASNGTLKYEKIINYKIEFTSISSNVIKEYLSLNPASKDLTEEQKNRIIMYSDNDMRKIKIAIYELQMMKFCFGINDWNNNNQITDNQSNNEQKINEYLSRSLISTKEISPFEETKEIFLCMKSFSHCYKVHSKNAFLITDLMNENYFKRLSLLRLQDQKQYIEIVKEISDSMSKAYSIAYVLKGLGTSKSFFSCVLPSYIMNRNKSNTYSINYSELILDQSSNSNFSYSSTNSTSHKLIRKYSLINNIGKNSILNSKNAFFFISNYLKNIITNTNINDLSKTKIIVDFCKENNISIVDLASILKFDKTDTTFTISSKTKKFIDSMISKYEQSTTIIINKDPSMKPSKGRPLGSKNKTKTKSTKLNQMIDELR